MKVFPGGNGGVFTNNIFRIFDKDNNGFMDFKEFLIALDVTTCKTIEDKLNWAFQLYDIDGNGTIDLGEMTTIIEILDDLGGREVGAEYLVAGQPEVAPRPSMRAISAAGSGPGGREGGAGADVDGHGRVRRHLKGGVPRPRGQALRLRGRRWGQGLTA
jgi:hypothetical protein